MTSRQMATIAFSLVLLGAIGCSPAPEQKLIGTWEGKMIIDKAALEAQTDNPAAAAIASGMQDAMIKMVENLTAEAEFKADKTYTMNMPSPLGTIESNGSWAVISHDGNTLTVRLHPENKAAAEQSLTFADSNQFEMPFDNGKLQFTRVTGN